MGKDDAEGYYRDNAGKCTITNATCGFGCDCRTCNFALARQFDDMYLRADARRNVGQDKPMMEAEPTVKKSKK